MSSVFTRGLPFTASRLSSLLRRKYIRLLLLAVGGALTALTLVFSTLWLLEWVSLVPSALVILSLLTDRSVKYRTLYLYGLAFFESIYVVVFHWFFAMYPLDFAGLSPFASMLVVLAGVFGLSLLQALISALALPLCRLALRSPILSERPFAAPFVFAAAYTVFEWLQNFGWWGVPWGRLSLGQIDASVTVQTASVLGSYFITLLLVLVNFLIAYTILFVPFRRISAGIASALFLLNLISGSCLLLRDHTEGEPIRVAAIQGNIENKWAIGSLVGIKNVYRENTLRAAKEGATLILWPETALPCELTPSLRTFLSELAVEANATLLVGAIREETPEKGDGNLYNSLYVILPDGTISDETYDKQKLVPFGEFVPMKAFFEAIFPPLAEVGIIEEDLTKGAHGQTIPLRDATVGGMICFDSIYERVALGAVSSGAELLLLASNDTWFEDSAAMEMHHAHARMRAIETGRYVVRAGNSGVSSVISPTGQVLSRLDTLVEGYLVSDVYPITVRTPYALIGNLPVYLLLLSITVFAGHSILVSAAARKRSRSC